MQNFDCNLEGQKIEKKSQQDGECENLPLDSGHPRLPGERNREGSESSDRELELDTSSLDLCDGTGAFDNRSYCGLARFAPPSVGGFKTPGGGHRRPPHSVSTSPIAAKTPEHRCQVVLLNVRSISKGRLEAWRLHNRAWRLQNRGWRLQNRGLEAPKSRPGGSKSTQELSKTPFFKDM